MMSILEKNNTYYTLLNVTYFTYFSHSKLSNKTLEGMVCVHANTRPMDKTIDVDYEEANVDWMEMAGDSD